jgi:hypothetical protein
LIRTRGQLARQRQRPGVPGAPATEENAARGYDDVRNTESSSGRVAGDPARWEVEMHETARQLSAQLDAKLGLLQSLIVDADRAAARLEDALDRAYPTLPPGSQAESLRPAAVYARDVRHELQRGERGAGSGELGAGSPCSPLQAPSAPPSDRTRRREEIYRLADYGFAAAEIARRVGSPVGEVELILSLRDSGTQGGGG